ncbi:hypothetical protein MKX03_026556, partial [Papaver bracteatum]
MMSYEDMRRSGNEMIARNHTEDVPAPHMVPKPYEERHLKPIPVIVPGSGYYHYGMPVPPVMYSHLYPDFKPVSLRPPTNDMLPDGFKEFDLSDSNHPRGWDDDVRYKEGWYDLIWKEEDRSKELEYFRDPSKEKPQYEVQRAGPEDYPSLRRAG